MSALGISSDPWVDRGSSAPCRIFDVTLASLVSFSGARPAEVDGRGPLNLLAEFVGKPE